jgi:hypothetical protein
MPRYVIERELPGAGRLSPEELQQVAQKSCSVLRDLGPEIQWVHSYVTDDKLYCIYIGGPGRHRPDDRRGAAPARPAGRVRRPAIASGAGTARRGRRPTRG